MPFFDDHRTCGCCGLDATEAMLDHLAWQAAERVALDYEGLVRVLREETGDAPYVDGEVRLTQLLAENASSLADEVERPVLAALDLGYVDEAKITASMVTAGALWQAGAWPRTLETQYRETLSSLALLGQHDIAFGPELADLDRLRIVNGMSKSAKYYTNAYFNDHVMPAIVDAAHQSVLNGTSHDGDELRAIRALLDRRLHSVPYWNLVANVASSRAYHYGYLKAGVAAGLNTVQFVATVDERTSAICLSLNGTQWRGGDVALFADRIADVEGDGIKQVAPWMRASDVAGKSSRELLDMGVVIPPVHGHCRSQLMFID